MLKVEFDMTGLNAQLAAVQAKVKTAIRPAAQAGAQLLYDEVRARVPKDTGNLMASIYQKHTSSPSADGVLASYAISWRKGRGRGGVKTLGDGLAGLPVAFHGQLIEYGWVQRYAMHQGDDGQWYTLVRPSMRNKPPPRGRASQAVKDAYFVLRKGGPIVHAPRSFLRASYEARNTAALAAAKTEFERVLKS